MKCVGKFLYGCSTSDRGMLYLSQKGMRATAGGEGEERIWFRKFYWTLAPVHKPLLRPRRKPFNKEPDLLTHRRILYISHRLNAYAIKRHIFSPVLSLKSAWVSKTIPVKVALHNLFILTKSREKKKSLFEHLKL